MAMAASVLEDRDHVKTHRAAVRAAALRIGLARAPQMALFVVVHCFLRPPGFCGTPGLDLDEHERLAIHRDEVDLRARAAKITLQDEVALASHMTFGNPLASASQCDPIEAVKTSAIRNPADSRAHPSRRQVGE
jgi:hypothetical protein